MEIYTLKEKPQYYKELLKLVSKAFHYNDYHKIEIDFYPLFNKNNHENLYILLNDEQLIGHIGCVIENLIIYEKMYKIVLIGGIAIDEKFRGSGNFANFFKKVLELNKNNTLFYLLWSDLSSLYKKFDFFEVGAQYEYDLTQFHGSYNFYKQDINNIDEKLFVKIKLLFEEKLSNEFFGLNRDNKKWINIKNITSSNFYTALNEDKELIGYLFFEKGADLTNIVHEMILDKKYDISNFTFDNLSNNPKLWTTNKLSNKILPCKNLFHFFMKISNPDIFIKFVKDYSNNSVNIHFIENGRINFVINKIEYDVTVNQFLNGIFGPEYIEEFSSFNKPVFISGLESI